MATAILAGWEDRAYKIKDHVYVEPSTDDFKWALKEYGPISVVLEAPDDWYYYRSGVYSPVTDVGWANHAVLLTGWDDSDGCWFIKNSWGKNWGENGYARVKYGNLERYNYAYAITGIIDHGSSPDPAGWFKPVSAIASTEYNAHYAAARTIDNNTATHWFSDRHDANPEIIFDLGSMQTIHMGTGGRLRRTL
jgi:C1A family cysteine protease